MTNPEVSDPFAELKRRATERADRTVERLRAGIQVLQANGQKITAESIKHVTHDLEPGFSGLSFQVIRRNARAYALYRDAADAFSAKPASSTRQHNRGRRRARGPGQEPRSSYDPLQRLDKRDLVRRVRALEGELDAERRGRGALAYDQQVLRARLLRLETEIILLRTEGSPLV
jgi:hypothetical protein